MIYHWLCHVSGKWDHFLPIMMTEAEYVGMMETVHQIQWIQNLYEEIGFILGPLPLCIDNQGAIFLASNPA